MTTRQRGDVVKRIGKQYVLGEFEVAMARSKDGGGQEGGNELLERQRVLIHASSLNRSDIIKKVVSAENNPQQNSVAAAPGSRQGGDGDVDREVLDHVDGQGLTALHHAVKKSSLDVGLALNSRLLHPIYGGIHTCSSQQQGK